MKKKIIQLKRLTTALYIFLIVNIFTVDLAATENGSLQKEQTNSSTCVDFYPMEIAVNNPKIDIRLGASHGWESICLSGSRTKDYAYITLCKNKSKVFVYTKTAESEIYEWKETALFNDIIHTVDNGYDMSIKIEDRIFDNLYCIGLKSTKIREKNVECLSDKSYIPFKVDLPDKDYDKFYSLVLKNSNVLYVISGSLNCRSKLYCNTDYKKNEFDKTEKEEYNNLCAISLKEFMNKNIPTLGNTENFSFYLRNYLEYLCENDYPVFGNQYVSNILTNIQNKSYDNYREITEKEGEEIASAAKRYLNWAVEYILGSEIFDSEIKEGVENWGDFNDRYKLNYWPESESEFPSEKNGGKGNPVPYVKGGIDTPRTFWKKMQLSEYSRTVFGKETGYNNYHITTGNVLSSYRTFMPGIGKDNFKYAGTDSLGFLTGVIAMSSLKDSVYTIHGRKAAKELDIYSKEVEKLITPENYDKYHSKDVNTFLKEMTEISFNYLDGEYAGFNWKDIDFMTKVVPAFKEIRKGDFLVCENSGKGCIAVVTDVTETQAEIVFVDEVLHGKTIKKEIKGFGNHTARRLVVYDNNQNEEKNVEDVLDMNPDENLSSVVINSKYEQTQKDNVKKSKWHFIPNTGEYLILEISDIKLKNKCGIDLLKIYGNERYKAVVCAKDRDYRSENNDDYGNIYNNRASKFSVAYKTGTEAFTKKYTIIRDEQNNAYGGPNTYRTSSMSNYLYINEDGMLCDKNSLDDSVESIKIGIRPDSVETAYPGDDLIIGFEIESKKYKNIVSLSKVWSNDKDYIAVYDKKMFWRANLYIDEGENDWNNVHPWNTTDTSIEWFGKNEWNRQLDFNSSANNVFYNNLTNLPAGNGGQVVKYNDSTPWYYGMEDNLATQYAQTGFVNPHNSSHERTINSAVAYDYWGWDNPFSYNKKMKEQELLTKQLKPGTNQINNYIQMIFPMDYGRLTAGIPDSIYYSAADDPAFYPKFFDTYTTTPNNNSVITRSNPVSYLSNTSIILHPYLPGLTDSISYKIGDIEKHPYDRSTLSKLTAGIDCNGLIQSSMSYQSNSYVALGTNTVTPVFWGDNNNNIPIMSRMVNKDAGNDYTQFEGENQTAYKIMDRDKKEVLKDKQGNPIQTTDDSGNTVDEYVYKCFKYLVPGDIVVYCTSSGAPSHVMMVSAIEDGTTEYKKDKDSIEVDFHWKNGSSVKILESVYHASNETFGVVKTRTLDRLSQNGNLWEIWRLKK